jgi:hypothetical protein
VRTRRRTGFDGAAGLRAAGLALVGLFLGPSACADKSPPARFSDPPPPALAHPLPESAAHGREAESAESPAHGREAEASEPDQVASEESGETESETST